ncbi:hypothetical protein GCM10010383_03540 [Streptomyces lomondensis]|uniref:Chaplin domain-containing protein n=1 Tax=Streptomyces lomondensis TaxID=68229 RepID=A0ABQ2WWC1_9ACTN|nr:hypothetical protein GCM10010383_03540 [Streptomyces lomondensis]
MFAAAAATGILSLSGSPVLADTQAAAATKDSPDLLSDNTVAVPVDVPVNVCGNALDAVAAISRAYGNSCGDGDSHGTHDRSTKHAYGTHDRTAKHAYGTHDRTASPSSGSAGHADTHAAGAGKDSPDVLSDNTVVMPVRVPVNVCGNGIDAVAAISRAYGNVCGDGDSYGTDDRSTKPSYGDSGYGVEDDTPASPGGKKTPPPADDHATPPPVSRHTPPPTRSSETPPPVGKAREEAPQLAETGSEGLLAASAASAALIAGGVLMHRRGRATSSR